MKESLNNLFGGCTIDYVGRFKSFLDASDIQFEQAHLRIMRLPIFLWQLPNTLEIKLLDVDVVLTQFVYSICLFVCLFVCV